MTNPDVRELLEQAQLMLESKSSTHTSDPQTQAFIAYGYSLIRIADALVGIKDELHEGNETAHNSTSATLQIGIQLDMLRSLLNERLK